MSHDTCSTSSYGTPTVARYGTTRGSSDDVWCVENISATTRDLTSSHHPADQHWRWRSCGINAGLDLIGVQGPNWLRDETASMISVIVVQVIKNVGLNMVLFLAALQGVPRELYEAATVDSAGRWRQF